MGGGGAAGQEGWDPTAKPRTDTKDSKRPSSRQQTICLPGQNGALGTLVQPVTHTAVSCGSPQAVLMGKNHKELQNQEQVKLSIDHSDKQHHLPSTARQPQHWEKALHVSSQEETQHTAPLPSSAPSFLAIHL